MRSSAEGVVILGFTPGHYMQHAADNADRNDINLDGSGTLHSMGIVADITLKLNWTSIEKRLSVPGDNVSKVGRINNRFYWASRDGMKCQN